jgi:SAM-dependent methyltransferase
LKVFIYIFYFFRSVFLRGFINTIKLIKAETINEKKYSITTSSIKKSNSTEFFHYQGAGYLVLFRIFRAIEEKTKNFAFVDIGCGKGRPVFVAESFGYNNLTGIDLDGELIDIANENLKNYLLKRESSNIKFIKVNALDYAYLNQPTVYFLFNPFNEAVLDKTINKILSSTSSETWFVYMNPMFKNCFVHEKIEVVCELKTKRYLEAIIYRVKH